MYHKNRVEAQSVGKRNQKEEKSFAKKLEHQINPVQKQKITEFDIKAK